jgi:hypothetical protein
MVEYKEVWSPIEGTNCKYFISSYGKIISFVPDTKFMFLSQRIDRDGYLTVRLSIGGKSLTKFVHRLVAETFIENPKGKPFVNHINGLKTSNDARNLEWVTHSENMQHAYIAGLCNKNRDLIVDKCTGKTYNSIMSAARDLKISYSTCRSYLNGVIKTNKTCLEYKIKATGAISA